MGRGALLTGVAGGIIGTIAAVIGIVWFIFAFFIGPELFIVPYVGFIYTGPSALAIGISILFVALIIVACILTGIGFYGMYTAGGGAMGIVGLIFGIIGGVAAGILFLIGTFLPYDPFSYYTPILAWGWIGLIILGVSFIIMGSASIVVREYSMHSGTAVAAGILSIIGGSCLIVYIISFIGFVLLFVAFLLWAIVFYGTEA
jgi:hypothetical protein